MYLRFHPYSLHYNFKNLEYFMKFRILFFNIYFYLESMAKILDFFRKINLHHLNIFFAKKKMIGLRYYQYEPTIYYFICKYIFYQMLSNMWWVCSHDRAPHMHELAIPPLLVLFCLYYCLGCKFSPSSLIVLRN